ncbi:MAG: TonB-dependent receptor [Prevotellaceae bacterium]|nr:TonB-dependent receptor [Prevotellaceae bacterium]
MRKKIKLFILLLLVGSSSYAQHQVTGKVTAGDTNEPVPYASVVLKGETRYTTTTDDNGNYSISLPSGEGILVASFVGYQSLDVAINNRSIIDFTLEPDATTLDEAMVVAYGVVSKGSYSGSASVIKADKIQDVPVVSFEQALSGSAPGVTLGSTSGLPGSFPEIRIRGVGSMNAGNDPLYVIDGIPATSGDLSTANTGTSAMNFLNPSDIESITILKDAAAASLYGSRAANGVVLITTKKGRSGKTQFRFKAEIGFSDFAFNNHPLATDAEHEMLHREAWTNFSTEYPADSWQDPDDPYPSQEAYVNAMVEKYYPSKKAGLGYVDWRKKLFQTAVTQNYELSISGGNEKTRFFLSGGYNKNEAVTVGRYFDRFSGTFNLEHKATKYITMGAGVQFSNTDQAGHQEGTVAYDNPWWAALSFLTYRWPAYNADGTYWTGVYDPNNSSYRSPLLNNDTQITTSAQTRVLIKPWVEMNIIDGLKAKSTFGYDGLYLRDRFGWLPEHANGQAYGDGFYTVKHHEYLKLVSSTTLNYNKTFANDHTFGAMVGWEAEKQHNYHDYLGKVDMASIKYISLTLTGNVLDLYDYEDESTMLSFLSSLNYSYKSKYFLTATYRRDGSSRLAPDHRWGDFWSVSGSWRIINESFMQNISWLNDLRVRASYGVSGTLPTNWYYYKPYYRFETYGQGDGGLYINEPANEELTWEKNHSMNIALETRVLDRVSLSADFYIKKTKDLLMNATTASISGYSTYLRNVGEMQNKGVELDINVDIIKNKDITWTAGVNWTYNKNEITKMSFEGEQIISSSVFLFKEGYSYNQYYSREYAGVDPQTGKVQFYKNSKNADGTYDKTIVNSASSASSIILEGKTGDPKGYGGITTSFRYKNLSVGLVFNYMYGHYVFDQAQDQLQQDGGYYYYRAISKEQLRRWQKPGDITDVPRRMPGDEAGYYNSSRMLQKGDFIRLKNMTISYNLPKAWTNKAGIDNVRVYAAGNNVFALTGLYFDPELSNARGFSNRQTPPTRTISFGIEVSL